MLSTTVFEAKRFAYNLHECVPDVSGKVFCIKDVCNQPFLTFEEIDRCRVVSAVGSLVNINFEWDFLSASEGLNWRLGRLNEGFIVDNEGENDDVNDVDVNDANDVNDVKEVFDVWQVSTLCKSLTFMDTRTGFVNGFANLITMSLNDDDDRTYRTSDTHQNKIDEVRKESARVPKRLLISNIHFRRILLMLMLRSGDLEQNPGPINDGAQRQQDQWRQQGQQGQQDPDTQRGLQGGPEEGARTRGKCDLQVVSLNVRGLGDVKKVRHLVNTCYKMNSAAVNSVYLMQETYVMKLDLLRYLWRGESQLTAGNGNSLGCITLVTAPYKIVHCTELGLRGHVLALSKDDLNKVDVVVANAYAPNGLDNEKRRFFDEVLDAIFEVKTTYNCSKVILGGDLNVVLNDDELKNRAYTSGERRLADELKLLLSQAELVDGWQKVKAATSCFTWTSNRSGMPSFSTLDRVLYTDSTFVLKRQVADWSMSVSDHAAVITHLDEIRANHTHADFIPRLDPRLLLDPEGTTAMDEVFAEMYGQRSRDWSPHVSLEYCKMCIRTAANVAIGKIKARYRDEERSINESINLMINSLANDVHSSEQRELLMHKLDDLRQLKRCLVEKIGAKLERRTARKWYNEGELSSKYFFNLMNRKSNDDVKVILRGNEELTEIVDIENEVRNFYKDLYEEVPVGLETNDDIFRHIDPVSEENAATIVERLSIDDLEKTLKTCDDSAPGPDGIPYSFLKHFWKDVGPALVESWNHSLDTNQLPQSHKISYLRLIPKVGKDRRVIGNLRPITL